MSIFKRLRRLVGPSFLGLLAFSAQADLNTEAAQKVQGKVSAYATLERDGWVDVSVVVPTLSEEQILAFDFTSLLAPNESMKAGPITTEVPGNLHVPEQKERYGIIPVTLRKDAFTLMMEPGERQELFALSVRAPFSELAGKARQKAPFGELMKLVKFGQLAFHSERDWTRERNVDIVLNRERPRTTSVAWTRQAPAKNESDVVVNLEETPAGKWLVSDFDTQPQASIALRSTNFTGLGKFALARVLFGDDGRSVKNVRAWFPTHARGSRLNATGLPAAITGLKWQSGNVLAWNPGDKSGWAIVIREEILVKNEKPEVDTSKVFFPDLSDLVDFARPRLTTTWVRVESGQIQLEASMMKKSRLAFVFLGGGADLDAAPSLAGADELQVHDVTP
jgi:hypothetical protein